MNSYLKTIILTETPFLTFYPSLYRFVTNVSEALYRMKVQQLVSHGLDDSVLIFDFLFFEQLTCNYQLMGSSSIILDYTVSNVTKPL